MQGRHMRDVNVLSLFDGISCGQLALKRAGIGVNHYFASEIDKKAMAVTQYHFPNTTQLGDVVDVKGRGLPKIDLVIGGSPCQGFSRSGGRLHFDDPRSRLFFEYVRLIEETDPKYFLLENVVMREDSRDVITSILGVEPVLINSSDFSAQTRRRHYWTNIPFDKDYEPKNVLLRDVLEPYYHSEDISDDEIERQISALLATSKYHHTFKWRRDTANRVLVMRPDGLKIQRIGRVGFGSNKSELCTVRVVPHVFDGKTIRPVNPLEAERLQTLPDNYTAVNDMATTTRHRMIGNCWTVDVIAHILRGIDRCCGGVGDPGDCQCR